MLLNDIVRVDDEDIATALVGADGLLGHEHGVDLAKRHMHADEIARQKPETLVLENAAHIQRAGRWIDIRCDIVDHAFVRKVAICLQRDLDGHLANDVRGGDAVLRHRGADCLHVMLADGEIHPDRVELVDRCELGRRIGADEFADRDETLRHSAIERRRNLRITGIDLRLLKIGLVLLDRSLIDVTVCARLVEICLRRDLPRDERLLAAELYRGLQKLRFGAVKRGLRLIHLQLVGQRLDHEERRALFDRRAVFVFDALHEALNARDEIDGVDRRHISRGFKIGLYGLLQRIGDTDLGRRRRHEGIIPSRTPRAASKAQGLRRAAQSWKSPAFVPLEPCRPKCGQT